MIIKKDSFLIRVATEDDAKILCQWWNDGLVMAHAGFPNGLNTTVDDVINQINHNNDHHLFILEHQDKAIGEAGYRTIADGVAEIGIKICELSEQEKGYGTQFIKMMIDYLFNTLNFNKIILDTNLMNTRAQHVYEKIGFRKIRINYHAWKDQLGNLQSSVDYELTKEDDQKI